MGESKEKANDGKIRSKSGHSYPTGARLPASKVASIIAQAELGVPYREIARREDVSINTAFYVAKQGDQNDSRLVERIKKKLASHFYVTAERSLNAITDDKLEKSSAYQLATVSAISVDKARLLDGLPTTRIEFQGAEDKQLDADIERLQAELDGWKEGKIINAGVSSGVNDDPSSVDDVQLSGELHTPDNAASDGENAGQEDGKTPPGGPPAPTPS